MPIYEYNCTECGHHFELIQKITDKPTKTCPKCLQETAQKLVSAPNFKLKGTGWYETDFKNKGKGANSASEKSAGESKPKETRSTKKKESKD